MSSRLDGRLEQPLTAASATTARGVEATALDRATGDPQ
ncbi:hypothetical protein ABH925_006526 [Streptacidiphilus sp. EB129]